MSCHVMSCRHYCIEFLKKSFSKTFLFFKIIYKYFAGFLACINKLFKSLRAVRRSNPLFTDCHADKSARNDAVIHCHYEAIYSRSNPANRNFIIFDCFANARTLGDCPLSACAPYGDDAMVYIQFDKFQRFLSVIYKKIYY